MSDTTAPDDDWAARPSPRRPEPDAHGQAALLLAESIIHALIETNTWTVGQAKSVVRTACEVKVDIAADTGESAGRMEQSLDLLAAIQRSLMAGTDHLRVID